MVKEAQDARAADKQLPVFDRGGQRRLEQSGQRGVRDRRWTYRELVSDVICCRTSRRLSTAVPTCPARPSTVSTTPRKKFAGKRKICPSTHLGACNGADPTRTASVAKRMNCGKPKAGRMAATRITGTRPGKLSRSRTARLRRFCRGIPGPRSRSRTPRRRSATSPIFRT